MSFLGTLVQAYAPEERMRASAVDRIAEELAWEGAQGADRYLVGFSGGKDSIACFLHLLERGVPLDRIELWHHRIDPPGQPFMDWPCTHAYCQAFAEAFEVPLYFSGKEGGFEGELLRDHQPTATVRFDTPAGERVAREVAVPASDYDTYIARGLVKLTQPTVKKRKGVETIEPPKMTEAEALVYLPKWYQTRLRFPQITADLSVRWCSSYLKIDVAARVLTNDPRFNAGRYILVTGERAQESTARARYPLLDEHKSNSRRRHVHQWRPVHAWDETAVWAILQRWGVVPHPAYQLGFGRVSCMSCIFGNPNQWATVQALNPLHFEKIADYEDQFGVTIRREGSVREAAAEGASFIQADDPLASASQLPFFLGPIRVHPAEWKLPKGAYRKDGGPI